MRYLSAVALPDMIGTILLPAALLLLPLPLPLYRHRYRLYQLAAPSLCGTYVVRAG